MSGEDIGIQRQVDQLEGKIDKLDTKVDSFAREVRVGMEGMTKLLDERWRSVEQRFDMSDRQQQQNIELLGAQVQRIELHQSGVETQQSLLEGEQKVMKTEHDNLKTELASVKENLKWVVRTIVGAIIAIAIWYMTSGRH